MQMRWLKPYITASGKYLVHKPDLEQTILRSQIFIATTQEHTEPVKIVKTHS